MVLAFGPSPATWAVVSVRTLSNSILALGDHESSMLTPSFSFAVGLHTLAAPSSLASCWARWRWEGLVWPCLTPLSLSLVWLAFGGGLLLDCTGFGGRCFHLCSSHRLGRSFFASLGFLGSFFLASVGLLGAVIVDIFLGWVPLTNLKLSVVPLSLELMGLRRKRWQCYGQSLLQRTLRPDKRGRESPGNSAGSMDPDVRFSLMTPRS